MNKEEFDQLNIFEEKYWWHVGRRFFISDLLGNFLPDCRNDIKILDFGCGTGGNFELLSGFGEVIGVDNSPDAIEYCRKKNKFAKLIDGKNLPYSEESFSLVISLDVLEHINNDVDILKEYRRVLKNKGKVLITVPAYQFIWSEHDDLLGHCRRYSIQDLKFKFEQNGFKVLKISHSVTIIFPLILAYRAYRIFFSKFLSRKKTSYVIFPKFINEIFIYIMKIESFLLKKMDLPFGCSIVGVFEKEI